MADVNEQMTSLLEKEELPYADDATAATDYITKPFARETRKYASSPSKPFNPIESQALLESYKPEIKEARQEYKSEENKETAKSIGTGLATGFFGLPSDVLEGVNFVNDYLAEQGSPKAIIFKDALNKVREDYGRDAFDKKFTEITGIKSDASNIDQIVGEILSPAGAIVATVKGGVKATQGAIKLYDFLQDAFKTQTNLLRGDIPPGGATQLVTGNVDNTATQMGNINQIKNKEIAAAAVDAAKTTKTVDSGDPNRPIINLSEIGIKTPDGLAASKTYEKLEADAMGGSYNEERYTELTLAEKDKLFRETGVYRGSEGKFRYKISTGDAQLNQGYLRDLGVIEDGAVPVFNTSKLPKEGLSIKEILNFQDLYRNYGSVKSNGDYGLLENIKVKSFDSYIKEMGLGQEAMTDLKNTQAIYSRHEGVETIYIRSGKNIKATKDDLLHEIQHAIQHREGFIAGSSPEAFLNGKTQFGKDYQANINSTFYEKRDAFTQLEKRVGDDGKRIFASFLDDKDLFESVTDKLVKREYEKILQGVANKPSKSQNYNTVSIRFPIPGAGVRYLNTGDLLVDPPSFLRNEMKPMEYKGYDGNKITFNEKEADLANALSNKVGFQDYVRQRIILENNVRNQKLMEFEAHQMYQDVIGEVQARKIEEDNDLYRIAKDKMGYKPNETVPKEVQEEIFRQIKPSKTGLLEGQTVKPKGSNVDIQANVKEQ